MKKKLILIIIILTVIYFLYSSHELLIFNDSPKYINTIVTPVLDTKIEKNKNMIYCSTFQMSWNEMCKLLDETIEIENAPECVSKLNNLINQSIKISEDSYIACAGFKKDNIVEKINQDLKVKFQSPPVLNERLEREYDILAYSYLNKSIEFENKFENIDDPLIFKFSTTESEVSAFGIKMYDYFKKNERLILMADQVQILYWSREDIMPKGCIIKLKTMSPSDDIFISTLAVEDTLDSTYEKIKDFIDNKFDKYAPETYKSKSTELMELIKSLEIINVNFKLCNSLMIPKINFNIIYSFSEIKNKILKNKKLLKKYNLDQNYFYYISEAVQDINFKLNEEGAKIESSAKFKAALGSDFTPRPLHINGPFIIFLQNKLANKPYFMAYIANDELLERVK